MIDTTAHDDATVVTDFNNTVGNTGLFDEDSSYPIVNTTELNRFVLDGSYENAPNNYVVPFWSSEESGEDCGFPTVPNLCVRFTEPHTSTGITLKFLEDYPTEILVSWYFDSNCNIKIDSKRFYPNSTEYYCFNQVENYKAIKVEFIKTRLPKQYVRATFVLYGQILTWADEDVMSATVNEEVDATSATIPINTCEITLVDENNDFNIQNENGLWKSLQANQKVVLTENVNGTIVDVGTFFIDSWDSKENAISLNLIDAVGLVDKTKFMGGMYTNTKVSEIVSEIMNSANYTEYSLSDVLGSIRVSGYIPICSHREALQQIAFAIGAVIDCSRGSYINIYVPDRNVDSYILLNRKFSGKTSATLDDYVSGVSIACTQYKATDEEREIYNGYLEKGTHKIEFSEPYRELTVTGGTVTEAHVNYAVITVATSGDVVLNGKGYESTEFTISKNVDVMEVGQVANVKAFSGLTICNKQMLPMIAEQLLKWYSLRQKVSLQYICDSEKVGEWVGIQDSIKTSTYAITRINSQKIDLTGGYLATAECRGYATVVSSYNYMGNDELLMGMEGII